MDADFRNRGGFPSPNVEGTDPSGIEERPFQIRHRRSQVGKDVTSTKNDEDLTAVCVAKVRKLKKPGDR